MPSQLGHEAQGEPEHAVLQRIHVRFLSMLHDGFSTRLRKQQLHKHPIQRLQRNSQQCVLRSKNSVLSCNVHYPLRDQRCLIVQLSGVLDGYEKCVLLQNQCLHRLHLFSGLLKEEWHPHVCCRWVHQFGLLPSSKWVLL